MEGDFFGSLVHMCIMDLKWPRVKAISYTNCVTSLGSFFGAFNY